LCSLFTLKPIAIPETKVLLQINSSRTPEGVMMNIYRYLTVILCLNLIACIEPPPAQNQAASGSTAPLSRGEVPSVLPTVSTVELIADQGFTFESQFELTVQVDLPALAGKSAVVNICHPKPDAVIDRNKCVTRSTLTHGRLELMLNMAAHQQALVLEVWQRSNMNQPLTYRWAAADGTLWQIEP